MTQTNYLWSPPPVYSLPVHGSKARYPVNRIFCVGRNYHAHAIEMGVPVDKTTAQPFYFTKAASTLVESGATVPYPTGTANYHHEMELVVAIGAPGFRVTESDAEHLIYGYAPGLDMTRRDLQLVAREQGRPWDLGKDFELSAVCGEIVPIGNLGLLASGALTLDVNGQRRQTSDLSQLIWSIPESISHLSSFFTLAPGDLLFTGTPAGVGATQRGDRLQGGVDGVGEIEIRVV